MDIGTISIILVIGLVVLARHRNAARFGVGVHGVVGDDYEV